MLKLTTIPGQVLLIILLIRLSFSSFRVFLYEKYFKKKHHSV
nr:MAG TPA: hypothetical protein [Caudoviricetes sp.]